MQVRLTKKGQQALGFSPDRIIASISDNRAFAMMSNGMAIPDKGFMALFDGDVPTLVEKLKSKKEIKKEKAVSKKAANREIRRLTNG